MLKQQDKSSSLIFLLDTPNFKVPLIRMTKNIFLSSLLFFNCCYSNVLYCKMYKKCSAAQRKIEKEVRPAPSAGMEICLVYFSSHQKHLNSLPMYFLLSNCSSSLELPSRNIILITSFHYLESCASPPLSAGENVRSQCTCRNRYLPTFPRLIPSLSPLPDMYCSLC